MAPITEVAINGTPLDLSQVEWAIAIDHGRNDISSPPQASSAELVIRGFDTMPATIADTLTIEAYGTPRFTGVVSDTELYHEYGQDGPTGRLRIIAMGTLTKLSMFEVGDAGYAEETLDDRVTAILDETGLTYTANTDPYMVLLAQASGNPSSAMQAITDICFATGATICDLPDGSILFESYSRRGVGYNPATFAQVTDTFTNVPYIWSDVYNATNAVPTPVTLPAGSVVWEPVWKQSIVPVINQATVVYGSPEATMTFTDNTSVSTYGLRSVTINTQLADTTDAYDRASHIVTTQAYPRYGLTQVQVAVELLDSTTRTALLDVTQGSRIQVTNLPNPAPQPIYLGVVEGWSESHTPEGYYLTLSLSDPRYSYAMALWSQVSGSLLWSAVNPSIKWYDVVLPSDLAA